MLQAGFARLDVTPPLGSFVAGHFRDRFAKEVLDPITLNALAVNDGKETVLIISADFLLISMKNADVIRGIISERVNIPAQNIMLCCLHQHSSIVLRDNVLVKSRRNTLQDRTYIDVLYRKFADVAQLAVQDLKDAELGTAILPTEEPLSFVRRYVMKDGTIATNPGGRRDEIVRPCDEADNNVRLCRFKRKDGNDIALVNFSTHADTIHKELFSADWPGFVRRYVEQDLKDVSCIVTVGAQGDTNHVEFMAEKIRDGYGHTDHMGRVIANSVLKMWDCTKERTVEKITSEIDIVYNRTRTEGEERYDACKKLLDDYHANPSDIHITILGEATRIVNLRNQTIYQKVPVTVINMGDVGFVGFGGEPFTQYTRAIQDACPDRFIIFSCCSNGGEGYLPTAKAFEEGGYETGSSPFSPCLEEDCVRMAVNLLNKK